MKVSYLKSCGIRAVVAMALMAALPSRVFGQEQHGAAHEGAAKEEMPNILSGDLGNVFWTTTIFLVLLIVLRATAWKPILSALQNREKFILDSLDAARRDRSEAERVLREYTAKVERAQAEAAAIIEEARRDADEVRKRIHGETKVEADAILVRAKKDIELARDDAVKSLHDLSIQLATTVAGKLIRRELSTSDHQALLNESLSELSKMN